MLPRSSTPAGGVIVLGVEEDEQARATATPGVTLTDVEVARMRQVLASGVSPMPTLDILQVPDKVTDPTYGYYVIATRRPDRSPRDPGRQGLDDMAAAMTDTG